MTSKGTLLVAVAGIIGLGCSSPADDDGGEMKPAPLVNPPFVGQPQTQMAAQNNPQTALTPTPTNEGQGGSAATNVQQQTPVTASGGSAGAGAMPAPGTTIPIGVPGTGFSLTPMAGWVAGGTNEAGIQGAFSTISDAT